MQTFALLGFEVILNLFLSIDKLECPFLDQGPLAESYFSPLLLSMEIGDTDNTLLGWVKQHPFFSFFMS